MSFIDLVVILQMRANNDPTPKAIEEGRGRGIEVSILSVKYTKGVVSLKNRLAKVPTFVIFSNEFQHNNKRNRIVRRGFLSRTSYYC